MSERTHANIVVRQNVVCQSSRHGADIALIVVHDTEGANIKGIRDLQGLANYFDNIRTQASSHVATDADGNSARMVGDHAKAWHCAYYNSVSLGIEQIGFASQQSWVEAELRETARWIAHWHIHYGIPIRKGAVTLDGRVSKHGVVRHSDLGNLGGGHRDPGPNYPLRHVLDLARHFSRLRGH